MDNCKNITKPKTRVYNYLAKLDLFKQLPETISDDTVFFPRNFLLNTKKRHLYTDEEGKLVFEPGKKTPMTWETFVNKELIASVSKIYGMVLPSDTKIVNFILPGEGKTKYIDPYIQFNQEILDRIEKYAYEYPQELVPPQMEESNKLEPDEFTAEESPSPSITPPIVEKGQYKLFEKTGTVPIKPGVPELFKSNPELANIGTQQQYSQYLDSIFPDSKVKDIVYHGTPDDIQEFDKTKSQVSDVLYFSNDKEDAEGYRKNKRRKIVWTNGVFEYNGFKYASKYDQDSKEYYYLKKDVNIGSEKLDVKTARTKYEITEKEFKDAVDKVLSGGKVIPSLLNIKNLYNGVGEDLFFGGSESFKEEGYDGFITNDDGGRPSIFAVFEPEQIHILGSKQDIEGFKEFVREEPQKEASPVYEMSSEEREQRFQDFYSKNQNISEEEAREYFNRCMI